MNSGSDPAKLFRAARRDKKPKGELALGLLVERTNDIAEIVNIVIGSPGSSARLQRGRVPSAHYAGQDTDFEERDELLLGINLAASGGRRLDAPCRAQHTIAIERQ